ncbi:uncharacterized protein THITE_156464 [Thermothielavioides terrestris NRRL 8126]|uniref:Uncharacterized protein n=1 Tax=Thermothielavioides terrestris (strain ATCC 38088 / NRRL 8126) TaxID=578455 RepID=G2REJ1_THETT|nr:uncharacterized protein THITE_156464 [Thermothielavioides terrestris NRRL 8126]AEO70966.1 hypothetical protein THITE_156464 [Thermothielavioides terrestris NRRL 8126]
MKLAYLAAALTSALRAGAAVAGPSPAARVVARQFDGGDGSSSCSWTDHCLGDSCDSDEDCDGDLACRDGECASPDSSQPGGPTANPTTIVVTTTVYVTSTPGVPTDSTGGGPADRVTRRRNTCVWLQPSCLHWYAWSTYSRYDGGILTLTLNVGFSCHSDADCGYSLIICRNGVCSL